MSVDMKEEGEERVGIWHCPKCDETFHAGHGKHSGVEDKCPRCGGMLEFAEEAP